MSERYTRVFSLPENLYATGSPVVIAAGALLKDNQTGKVLAQLKLTNIQYKKIKAVKVKLFPRDTMGQPLGEAIDYQYLDLQLTRDGDFGAKTPIPFPDATTRAFSVEVTAVVFTDNIVWNSDGSPWEPIPDNIPLHKKYDNLVIEQLRLEQSGICQFVVQEHKDLWLCTCGAVNHDGEARCHDCGKQLSQIHPLDVAGLTERADLRLAEEARQAAEEKATMEAAAAAVKKKTAKILKIAVPVVCIVIALIVLLNSVVIPAMQEKAALKKLEEQYTAAVALLDDGNIAEAYSAFVALETYKDSEEKANLIYSQHKFKLVQIGEYVTFGSYEQDNVTSNGKEDIEWLVLEKTEDKMLIISKFGVDCQQYNKTRTSITWATCTLREWLNHDFLSEAFSEDEKSYISPTMVSVEIFNSPDQEIEDQVFLLSKEEANKYCDSYSKLACLPTNYAVANGAEIKDNGNSWWWLRSPGLFDIQAAGVNASGIVKEQGSFVDRNTISVRPALWINLNK